MKPWITRAMGVALIVLSFAIGACNDQPEAGPDITPSGTPIPPHSETASPTETTSVPPALSPVETVRAWVDAYNGLLRSGDANEAIALAVEGCKTCHFEIDPTVEVLENGGRFEGGRWSVTAAKERARAGDSATAIVNAAVEIAGGTTWASQGAEPVRYEAERNILEFKLAQQDGRWLVSRIVYLR